MTEDECQGCRDGLLPKELSIKEWHDEYLKLAIYAVSIVDENAKLRELVRDLYEMAYPEYPSAFEAAFADRMRELRIEVG